MNGILIILRIIKVRSRLLFCFSSRTDTDANLAKGGERNALITMLNIL